MTGYVADVPLVASNGRTFLAIWRANGHLYGSAHDGRSEPPPATTVLANSGRATSLIAVGDDYLAALTLDDGSVQLVGIDERGHTTSVVRLDVAPMSEPQLAWNGQSVLLIGRGRVPNEQFVDTAPINAYLLTRDGALTRGIGAIATGATFGTAAGNGDFFVAFGSKAGLRLYRVGPNGDVRSGFVQVHTPASAFEQWPLAVQVVVRGAAIGIAWSSQSSMSRFAVVRDGVVEHLEVISGGIQLAATGSGYTTANGTALLRFDAEGKRLEGFQHFEGNQFYDLAAAGDLVEVVNGFATYKVTATSYDGGAAAPALTAILSKRPVRQSKPEVASDGDAFFASFAEGTADTNAGKFARFSASGQGFDGGGRPFGGTENSGKTFSVAFGGGRYLLAWSEGSQVGQLHLFAAFVGPDGSIGAPVFTRDNAVQPAVVWNGSGFLLLWTEVRAVYNTRIFGTTISALGSPGSPTQISPNPAIFENYGNPRAAWNGQEYLAVWMADDFTGLICSACLPPPPRGAYAIHITPNGTARESKAIPLLPLPRSDFAVTGVHVAAAGQQFLVLIDRVERVDASIVNAGGFETPHLFFEGLTGFWYEDIGVVSDVISHGDGFLAVLRFGDDDAHSWISTRRLSAWGTRSDADRGLEIGMPDQGWKDALAIAGNTSGEVAIVTSEGLPGDVARVHARVLSELPPAPAPPSPPRNVTAKIIGPRTIISWDASDGAEGYQVELSYPGYVVRQATTRADTNTYTANSAITRAAVRVRAYNGGGVSAPSTEIVPVNISRQRSTHH